MTPEGGGPIVRHTDNPIISSSGQNIVENFGFSSDFENHIRLLNDTLVTIFPPVMHGFNVRLSPSERDPVVEVSADVAAPYSVQIAADRRGARLRLSINEITSPQRLTLSDIKAFAQAAFPDRRVNFNMQPTDLALGRPVRIPGRAIPTNLYEEMTDPSWERTITEAMRESSRRLLQGILPNIREDIKTITEENLVFLTTRLEAAQVDVRFYSRYRENPGQRRVHRRESMLTDTPNQLYTHFELYFDDPSNPFMKFKADNDFWDDVVHCYLTEFDFPGSSSEVESAVQQVAMLLQQTHGYKNPDEGKYYLGEKGE